jgi:hypothetical protein
MFHVTLTGFPGFAPGRPEVSIVVEDHWSQIAETVERAKFSPVRIVAGLDLDVVPHRSYIHKYASPLLRVENTITEKLS